MGTFKLNKNSVLPIVIALIFFIIACFLQAIDDNISNWNISRFISLTAMYLFFGILAYWAVSVINRVSDKTIRFSNYNHFNELSFIIKVSKISCIL